MTDYLDVDGVDFVAFETAPFTAAFHHLSKFFVLEVHPGVCLRVVEVEVAGRVDVELHFTALAEAVGIDSEEGHLGEDVVDGGGCNFSCILGGYKITDHVCACVSELHHNFVDRHPLAGSLETFVFQDVFVGLDIFPSMLLLRAHPDKGTKNT